MAQLKNNVQWYGTEFIGQMKRGLTKNLTAAGTLLLKDVRAALNVDGRTVTETTTASGKTRRKYGKRGSSPSQPGEPPHKQSGRLRRDTFKQLKPKKMVMRVGTRAPHGGMLEFGTRKMAPRPYLRSTYAKDQAKIAQILTTPIQTQ